MLKQVAQARGKNNDQDEYEIGRIHRLLFAPQHLDKGPHRAAVARELEQAQQTEHPHESQIKQVV